MDGDHTGTTDSFFGDDEHHSPRDEIETGRSVGSARSSVSSSASSRSRSHSSASSSSSNSSYNSEVSAPNSPREAHSSAASSASGHSTARSNTSDESEKSAAELPNVDQSVPLDTARTNGTYESNDFESEKEDEVDQTLVDVAEQKQIEVDTAESNNNRVKEIGAGDANILTVNIPTGKTPRGDADDDDSDLTDVSSMVTPRPQDEPIEQPNNDTITSMSPTEVKSTAPLRPKSAHPNKGRTRKASTASVASKNSVNSSTSDFSHDLKHQSQIEKHRERLLYNTSKSSKDINQLLEAVLVLDQKGKKRERTQNPNPFPAKSVGSARRQPNFRDIERQKEIQKENDRLLKELTRQRRRPTSAVSVTSGRSRISTASTSSQYSTASAMEFRRTTNCKYSPVARNYHSKINRNREAKRIDQENLQLLRRLQNVKPSVQIQVSRQSVSTTPIRKTRPKNMRPKIVNTWTDGW